MISIETILRLKKEGRWHDTGNTKKTITSSSKTNIKQKRNRPEEELQKEIIDYYNSIKNTLPFETLLISHRNENNQGGWKGAMQGKIYNQMGRVEGIPDLQLLFKGTSIFIELKARYRCITPTGKLIEKQGLDNKQIEIHKKLESIGYKVYVMYEKKQFIYFIKTLDN